MVRPAIDFVEQIYRNTGNYKGIIFLDRDGTLIENVGYLSDKRQIKIIPEVPEAIRLLNKNKISCVVITNQPVVARGLISIAKLKEINNSFYESLHNEKAYLDAIYSCPHHPETGHEDIPQKARKYRIKCECRKPGIAMYQKALSEFGAFKVIGVVGDKTKDALAGNLLKTSSVIVRTGRGGDDNEFDAKVDYVCDNLLDAVQKLL